MNGFVRTVVLTQRQKVTRKWPISRERPTAGAGGGGGGGVLPEKLGGGVRPTSQNPYPIYDQNLRFLLPYL